MSSKKVSFKKYQSQRRQVRTFSAEFKKQKVQQLLEKKLTVQQISDLYQISRTSVYNWLYKYSQLERGVQTVVQMESEAKKTIELLNRVAELERIIGQKQLQLDLDEKIFEVLTTELGYDVKKKYEQLLSSGFEKTEINTPIK